MSACSLRVLARAEGLSYVLLVFVAMPLKHGLDEPLAVRVLGAIHGVLFLAWLGALVRSARASGWPRDLRWLGFVTSMIPIGFVFFEAALAEHEARAAELGDRPEDRAVETR